MIEVKPIDDLKEHTEGSTCGEYLCQGITLQKV